MSLLHADSEGSAGRYGQFRFGEDELVVYDREKESAWARIAAPATLQA